MRYMLDTNICIYAIKNDPESVYKNLIKHNNADICISVITYSELLYGVEKSKAVAKNKVALTLFLSNIEIMKFDDLAASTYGKVRSDLEKCGQPIGPLDTMIASHALSLECTLVTNNTKEFERVDNLKIENWSK